MSLNVSKTKIQLRFFKITFPFAVYLSLVNMIQCFTCEFSCSDNESLILHVEL